MRTVPAAVLAGIVLAACGPSPTASEDGRDDLRPGATSPGTAVERTEASDPQRRRDGDVADAVTDTGPLLPGWPSEIVFGIASVAHDRGAEADDAPSRERFGQLLTATLGVPVRVRAFGGQDALAAALLDGSVQVALVDGARVLDPQRGAGPRITLQVVRRGGIVVPTAWTALGPGSPCPEPPVELESGPAGGLQACAVPAEPSGAPGQDPSGADTVPAEPQLPVWLDASSTFVLVDDGSMAGHRYPAAQLAAALGLAVEDPEPDPGTGSSGDEAHAGLLDLLGDLDVRVVTGVDASVEVLGEGDDAVAALTVEQARALLRDGHEPILVAWGPWVPHEVVAVRHGVPGELAQALTHALETLAGTPHGAEALLDLAGVEGFAPVDDELVGAARRVAALAH